ncbi:helix-turn-helix domain-containing protein [Pedobacter antarcticus]|uniref:AraC family transcriptional regulator n=1 Tax=Pedobacter antarcticus TaxID=34086 RepID=UPI00292D9CDC|nr:helix-turn-helix domain-containing protein [Pedobacter antarcticus]
MLRVYRTVSKKTKYIPVNTIAASFDIGIAIERTYFGSSEAASLDSSEEAKQSHREDRHSFFILESGNVTLEIDFQEYEMCSSSVIYMHPDQIHRVLEFKEMTVTSLGINNENLNPEYITLLEKLIPARPLVLNQATFNLIAETSSLCIKFSERKNDKLYQSLLKDCCNTLVALIVSEYLASVKSTEVHSRFKVISDAFKSLLESNFVSIKSPSDFAQKLNITTPYLNECVRNSTGHPVSYHIHQRVILEAKRLLYHSNKSVKEIAAELGYDDYPYFSRLFTKVTGMTASTFRKKNLE